MTVKITIGLDDNGEISGKLVGHDAYADTPERVLVQVKQVDGSLQLMARLNGLTVGFPPAPVPFLPPDAERLVKDDGLLVEDTSAMMVSADVSLAELLSDHPKLGADLAKVLEAVRVAGQNKLTRRLADAVATTRKVAIDRKEILR